ncbi:hypothetical protein Q7C36_010840 [Tachysurus vachellii]|uniref:DUF4371 domain-containing protein n=1 Tax=Tachysurus vachellii TaxID=175792 RepID=A0AA88SP60_TACVA|nr:hypothetical protein Q7C36_010840 [Tachysurus vachellii]
MPADERAGSAENAEGREEDEPSGLPSTSGRAARQTHASQMDHPSSKARKYREEYINYGFTCIVINQIQHPQCVVCYEVLAHESPVKMQRHLNTKHPGLTDKPTEFSAERREKEKELQGQKKVLIKQTTIPTKAQRASYEVAYLIAQTKKQHTIGETQTSSNRKSRVMHGDKLAAELEQVLLSDGTVSRRITDMAQDIKCQLIDRVKKSERYTLRLDESTDVSSTAKLLVFVRYIFEGKLNEEMLFCMQLEVSCTGEDIFNNLDSKLKNEGLSWGECISVCTDGAGAMLRKKKGLKARHKGLLLHTEFRWLSQGNVLRRLYELQDEVRIFLTDQRSPLAEHLSDPDWVTRLAYLSCIFEKLNGLNVSLQGENTNILYLNDKVQVFARNLVHWRERSLLDHFHKYFPEGDTPDQYDWIRSPFNVTTANHLPSDMEDALIELRHW